MTLLHPTRPTGHVAPARPPHTPPPDTPAVPTRPADTPEEEVPEMTLTALLDAGAFGARLDPRDAYRFARGEQVTSSTGQPVRLSRPLDFLVVADHSDNMGFFPDLFAGKASVLADPTGRKWYDMIKSGQGNDAAMLRLSQAYTYGLGVERSLERADLWLARAAEAGNEEAVRTTRMLETAKEPTQ